MTIPKIIHRMWLDKNQDDNINFPAKYQEHIASFERHNPDFTTIFWNMRRVVQLFENNSDISQYYVMWSKLPHHIQKCDIARYVILHVYGGLYIDLDFRCHKNLSPLLNRDLLLVFEAREHSFDGGYVPITNGFMGSIPEHPFWKDFLNHLTPSINTKYGNVFLDVLNTTGTRILGKFYVDGKYKNVPTVDTCKILPIYIQGTRHKIANQCKNKRDFYTDTLWNEGSKWGEQFSNMNNSTSNGMFVIIILLLLVLVLC
jgi:inositol phosphorylceramide mannosyltransferase catalytic subunit